MCMPNLCLPCSHSDAYAVASPIFNKTKIHLEMSNARTAIHCNEKRNLVPFHNAFSVFHAFCTQKPCTQFKLHSRHNQCWFNKYASTVGLFLIYDKYTQMPIVILCFDFYCCKRQTASERIKDTLLPAILQHSNLLINSIKFVAPFRFMFEHIRLWHVNKCGAS